MSNQVAVVEEKGLTLGMDKRLAVTEEQKTLIKNTVFPNCTDDELALFIYTCQRRGVHPLDKMIHPVTRVDKDGVRKTTFQTGIDMMRSDAESSGEYDGQDEPEFEFDDAQNPDWPTVAKIKVYRKGISRPTVGVARWIEFYPGEKMGFQWRKMPTVMLAKCAEAQALRKAFPKQLENLYCPEEMAQADNPNTSTQNRQQTRSSSVKPAQRQPGQGKVIDGEAVSIDEEITALLAEITGGDYPAMDDLLKEVSHYHDKGKDKDFSFGMDRLSSTSLNWKNKVLPKLKAMRDEMGQGREPGAEG